MNRWECPRCGDVQECIGRFESTVVGHECPRNRNRWTEYQPIPKGDK